MPHSLRILSDAPNGGPDTILPSAEAIGVRGPSSCSSKHTAYASPSFYEDHVMAPCSIVSLQQSLPQPSLNHYWMVFSMSYGASRVLSSTRLILRLGYPSRRASKWNYHTYPGVEPSSSTQLDSSQVGHGSVDTSFSCTTAQLSVTMLGGLGIP
jgi:hypothetical protein